MEGLEYIYRYEDTLATVCEEFVSSGGVYAKGHILTFSFADFGTRYAITVSLDQLVDLGNSKSVRCNVLIYAIQQLDIISAPVAGCIVSVLYSGGRNLAIALQKIASAFAYRIAIEEQHPQWFRDDCFDYENVSTWEKAYE